MPGKLSDLLWAPLFARGYDRFNKIAEDAGLRDKRRALLAHARGRTLEIGAGTGVNLELHPDSVTELVLTEPDVHMTGSSKRSSRPLAGARRWWTPGPSTCRSPTRASTPRSQRSSSARPRPRPRPRRDRSGAAARGHLLFLEHVRASGPSAARWQDRLERPWGWFGRGCHPNRDTLATIEASRSRSRRWSETGCRRRLGSCGRWWWGARGGQPIPDRLLSGQVRDQRPLIAGSRRWRTSERTNSLSRDSGSAPIAGTNSARAAPAIPSANAHAWSIEPHSSIRATTRSIR